MSRSMDDDEESEENDAVIGTIFVRSDYGNFLDDFTSRLQKPDREQHITRGVAWLGGWGRKGRRIYVRFLIQ